MRKLRRFVCAAFMCCSFSIMQAQETFPVNGVADPRHGFYAFTGATIVKDAGTTLKNATLVIKDGRIVSVGTNIPVPKGAVEIKCSGKFIYPSFIDVYADYGTETPESAGFRFGQPAQLESISKGATGWNQAIKSETDAYKVFVADEKKAKPLRDAGFGTVLSHVRDGIARGTGTLVTLAESKENMVIIKDKASSHYSFNKGSSTQSYPSSQMGSIALLRQTFLDAQWYKNK